MTTETLRAGREAELVLGGHSALIWARCGAPERPTVVFVPGASHLGRIGYGYGETSDDDFLCPQLAARGFSVVALSYPLGHPALRQRSPAFGVRAWASQVAAATRIAVKSLALSKHVVIAAWSMAGRLVHRLPGELAAAQLTPELFVSLEGSDGLSVPGNPLEDLLIPDGRGLAALEPLLPLYRASLERQRRISESAIIDAEAYGTEFVAPFPVGLAGTAQRYRDGAFVVDLAEDLDDCGSLARLAPIPTAAISGVDDDRSRHSLLDGVVWGALATRALIADVTLPPKRSDRERLFRIVAGIPRRLSRHVDGGHMFFVGQPGANSTADAIESLVSEAGLLRDEIALLGRPDRG